MSFKLSLELLYDQSDVILAWFFSLTMAGILFYIITKKKRWPLIWSYVRTTNHRKIGMMYIISGVVFLFRGGVDALLIRAQLAFPEWEFWVLQEDKYNGLFTTHGTIMIFFAAMPLLIGLMNVVIPLQIGARDLAFPYLNALSFWLFLSGAVLFNLSFFLASPPNAGWTAYSPLALDQFTPGPGNSFYVFSIQISGIGTLLTGINMLVTIFRHRAPGMKWFRMPLFTWATLVTSFLILIAFSTLSAGLYLMMFDRQFGSNFFSGEGGNPLFWQHLFWIFGHPEVYIMALPAFGIFSDIISNFSKKPVFGYFTMVFSIILIGFFGLMVWVHHMFTVGLGPIVNTFFAIATMVIAVPTGIKVFNWLFTMRGGKLQLTTPMLFALGFIPSFVIGGVTGVMLAVPTADFQYHDSYFVVGHFHYTILSSTILGIFAGLYYWYPKIIGKVLDEKLGKWHFWLFIIGFQMTFLPMHFSGLQGMPRRTYTYTWEDGVFVFNAISSLGAMLMGASMLFLVWNLYVTHRKKEVAAEDVWDGRTLEWSVASPAPEETFQPMPRILSIDPLWRAKMEKKPMPHADKVRPMPVKTSALTPLILAGSLSMMCLLMIYQWYESAIVFALVCAGLLLVRSWRDERIPLFRNSHWTKEDRLILLMDKKTGFFGYLIMDSIVFLILFVTYVLFTPPLDEPFPSGIFKAKTLLISSALLLPSSITIWWAGSGFKKKSAGILWLGLIATLLLGIGFLVSSLHEFHSFIKEGYMLSSNGFMASYYVLVGLHFTHVLFGAGWLLSLMLQYKIGHIPHLLFEEKQKIFSYYWHFVDLIWVFIICIVYLPYL